MCAVTQAGGPIQYTFLQNVRIELIYGNFNAHALRTNYSIPELFRQKIDGMLVQLCNHALENVTKNQC